MYDVAIIGGGFSGLSAALLLGRYLRQTVIFDSGPTRNSRSKHVHAYLGFENSSPSELIQKAWKDVLQYDSIKVVREKVVEAEMIPDNEGTGFFILSTYLGHSIIKARYLIIATGVQDSKPNVKRKNKNFIIARLKCVSFALGVGNDICHFLELLLLPLLLPLIVALHTA